MRSVTVGLTAVAALLAASACTSDRDAPTSETINSTPAPGSPPPSTSALPTIAFDPCDDIDARLIQQFGFDPATRRAETGTIGPRDVVSCGYETSDRMLIFIAQNRPWQELPSTLSGTVDHITVNGREALYAVNGIGSNSCQVVMRTDFGAVVVDQSLLRLSGSDGVPNACDSIMEIAESVEPSIDE